MGVKRVALLFIVFLAVFVLPAPAHHGGAAYDRSTTLMLKATVTDFKFINPHVQIYFDVTDDKGNVVHWSSESPEDPGMLSRQGWSRTIIKSGDKITVVGHPAKSGAKVLSLEKVILADGTELENKILN